MDALTLSSWYTRQIYLGGPSQDQSTETNLARQTVLKFYSELSNPPYSIYIITSRHLFGMTWTYIIKDINIFLRSDISEQADPSTKKQMAILSQLVHFIYMNQPTHMY